MGQRDGWNVRRLTALASTGFAFAVAASLAPASAGAQVIVNDSWTDAGRTNGADAQDADWWTSSSSSGIEVSAGSLGLVSGSSGRGIHATFPTQTLANVGDTLTATYTFTTPATVGTGTSGFRVGLFDTVGRPLNADISASSGTPNPIYGYFGASPPTTGLPGYMVDMDVNTATDDFNIRQHDVPVTASTPSGRLMGTTTGFTSIDDSDNELFSFAPNTTYTGSLSITRTGETAVEVTSTLGEASFTALDETFDSVDFGMLGFWANSNLFGSSPDPDTANNGIDFSNVTIEFVPVPEPASLSLLALGLGWVARRPRRTV